MPGRPPAPFPACALTALFMAVASPCARADAPQPTPHVPVATPQATMFRPTIAVSGQIAAVQSATLAAQRAGVAAQVLFHSGETVAKGAVLLRMDDAEQRAQVALDRAKLDAAGRTVARDLRLRAISGIAIAQLESDQAARAEAAAQLALDTARQNRRTIRAPFAGVLGIRRLSAGDYIGAGAIITTITQTSPLRILFAVPETELTGIAFGDAFTFTLPSADATPHQGRILALSPSLNLTTRARMVEGRIANNAGTLLPGAFGQVEIATGTATAALDVPATAINYGPLGSFVYAVDHHGSADVVHAVYVRVLATKGATTTIATPVPAAPRRIVAIGGFKLDNGETIIPAAPATALQATPAAAGRKS
ncbi:MULTISPECIES: efflux RND transporter periplasmic adaptor subunit [Acidiphilium]|uniref:Membrane fusion protein, multidrug efflux system n=1 Tax=Acidiphilium rubrum TaxID=526 RepID=A0A8G2CLE2_ACIRU|nr:MULTISPECIES: efflux RND transporter periplasmic adaptor subunit [Acidiphilium]SIQ99467.1 membrane fusion protein, multidrug efflux system [Acidiphilium rubrum]